MSLNLVPDKQKRKWGRCDKCDRQKLDFLSNNYYQDALLSQTLVLFSFQEFPMEEPMRIN